jgi:hypothetical protein
VPAGADALLGRSVLGTAATPVTDPATPADAAAPVDPTAGATVEPVRPADPNAAVTGAEPAPGAAATATGGPADRPTDSTAPLPGGLPAGPAGAPGAGPDQTATPGALGQAGPAGVTGPQPAAPAAPAAGAPPPAATPTPLPPAAAQLAMRIAPLRLDADGIHRLTVNLHPADLGPVQVVAEIRNGDISVQLTGSTDAGTDAIRNALDDLRRELEDSGFGNCTLDLRQGNAQQDQARQQFEGAGYGGNRRNAGPAGGDPEPAESGPSTVRRAPGSSRLDVQA